MRRKHIPQRTCLGCRKVRPKREMVRIVRTPDQGVEIDQTGKRSGRGAYLCRQKACWDIALKKERLEYALKTNLTDEERTMLQQFAQGLPATEEGETQSSKPEAQTAQSSVVASPCGKRTGVGDEKLI